MHCEMQARPFSLVDFQGYQHHCSAFPCGLGSFKFQKYFVLAERSRDYRKVCIYIGLYRSQYRAIYSVFCAGSCFIWSWTMSSYEYSSSICNVCLPHNSQLSLLQCHAICKQGCILRDQVHHWSWRYRCFYTNIYPVQNYGAPIYKLRPHAPNLVIQSIGGVCAADADS